MTIVLMAVAFAAIGWCMFFMKLGECRDAHALSEKLIQEKAEVSTEVSRLKRSADCYAAELRKLAKDIDEDALGW